MAWSKSTRIKVMLVIDVMFFLLELGVGFAVHSLALMADAFHMVGALSERNPTCMLTFLRASSLTISFRCLSVCGRFQWQGKQPRTSSLMGYALPDSPYQRPADVNHFSGFAPRF